MKKILALVLALALIATLGITSAFAADEGFGRKVHRNPSHHGGSIPTAE